MTKGAATGWSDLGNTSAWTVLGTADVTGSGTTDILWHNNATGDTGIDLMTNATVAGWSDLGNTSAWTVLGIGDYAGNGVADILWRNNTTGQTGIDLTSNGMVSGWTNLGSDSSAWSVPSVGAGLGAVLINSPMMESGFGRSASAPARWRFPAVLGSTELCHTR